jgi:hypothetical protein
MTTKQTTRRARVNPIGEVTASNPVGTRVIASGPDAQFISYEFNGINHYLPNQQLDECSLPQAHRELIHRACTELDAVGGSLDCLTVDRHRLGGDHDGE